MNFNQFLLICILYREKLIGTEYRVSNEKGKTIDKKIITTSDIKISWLGNFLISFYLKNTLVMNWNDFKIFCALDKDETNYDLEKLTKILKIDLKDIV